MVARLFPDVAEHEHVFVKDGLPAYGCLDPLFDDCLPDDMVRDLSLLRMEKISDSCSGAHSMTSPSLFGEQDRDRVLPRVTSDGRFTSMPQFPAKAISRSVVMSPPSERSWPERIRPF